ncbi:hypothetical protein M3484_20755 [Pseudomonas sp. GX19020]|uniref:hypothetical protein n=1 Tax=Pseudomonas sp. GX19020 TaxID=2942277 RepID=UPI00201A1FEB|nr:hypothetical protein [Pseudomonas sp. GX19020]MCL4068991.1 hypothetical protein [Pseudomonas sp. GX19020]
MTNRPEGKLFSLIYGDRGTPRAPDEFAIGRISLVMDRLVGSPGRDRYSPQRAHNSSAIRDFISENIGVEFYDHLSWKDYLKRLKIDRQFNSITLCYRALSGIEKSIAKELVDSVRIILSEENVAYEIDNKGGFHPLIDAEFSSSLSSTLSSLTGTRHTGTLEKILSMEPALISNPKNYIAAIRATFDACENLYKVMFTKAPKLDSKTAKANLEALVQKTYADRPTVTRTTIKLVNGFGEWIDAAHNYRHAEGTEKPDQPEEELAILLISEGLAYIRWLAQIDAKNLP